MPARFRLPTTQGLTLRSIVLGRCPSGQRERAVNPSAYAYVGSNPTRPTIYEEGPARWAGPSSSSSSSSSMVGEAQVPQQRHFMSSAGHLTPGPAASALVLPMPCSLRSAASFVGRGRSGPLGFAEAAGAHRPQRWRRVMPTPNSGTPLRLVATSSSTSRPANGSPASRAAPGRQGTGGNAWLEGPGRRMADLGIPLQFNNFRADAVSRQGWTITSWWAARDAAR